MSASPPPQPASPNSTAHAYASNGLDILQAASDAAQAIQNAQALQDATDAAEAVAAIGELPHAAAPEMNASMNVSMNAHPTLMPGPAPGIAPPTMGDGSPSANGGSPAMASRDPTVNPKLTRLRRACDMCSMRKVKCDDSNHPCRPCRELGVDCTYSRETKRRGPPNKHAEAAKAAKRARMDGLPAGNGMAIVSPGPQTAAKTLLDISSDALLDAETIAPMPVLELLVDDFFTYIHPLSPFPHEPTFRQSFANREDRTRPEFLGLLASMVCALVASFPRSAREHLKASHGPELFPRAMIMIERCRDVTLLTRGSKWVLRQPKTLDDAATSYYLGLASGYIQQWNASRHFMSETLTLMRELGFSRPKHPRDLPTFGNDLSASDPLPFNNVKDQIGKRIFWCLLLAVRSFSQLAPAQADLAIAPSTPSLPYPAYPENVDDICVLANEIIHQTDGSVTLLTGFRFAIDIYTTMNGVVSLELAYGMTTLPWADQRILLRDGLVAAKSIAGNLPLELHSHLDLSGDKNGTAGESSSFEESGLVYVPPSWPNAQLPHDIRNVIKTQPQRRRQLQYEVQRANIFVSLLSTRSYFVEMYFNLRDIHLAEEQHQRQQEQAQNGTVDGGDKPDDQDPEDADVLAFMSSERDLLVQDTLSLVGSLAQRNLEPCGGSLIVRLRHIASARLADPPERKGPEALKLDDALAQLVDILIRLESAGPMGLAAGNMMDGSHQLEQMQMTQQDEDEETRHWADLRDFQLRYTANTAFEAL